MFSNIFWRNKSKLKLRIVEHAEKVRKLLIFKENSQYGHLSVFSNGFGVIRGEENNHNEEGRYLKPIKKDINDH